MEAAWSPETLLSYNITTWCQNPDDCDLSDMFIFTVSVQWI